MGVAYFFVVVGVVCCRHIRIIDDSSVYSC